MSKDLQEYQEIVDKQVINKLKPLVSNSHQWEAFNKYIDILIEQQRKALEQTDNNIIMYRSQGAITTLRRLKLLKDEVFRSEK
jgi:hypothetical protein